jgi:very-short-patch-repair endonuclease
MKNVDALLRERRALAAEDTAARQLFGGLWQGEQSAWDVLDGYIRWVVEFRGLCLTHGLREQAMELATHVRPDLSRVGALRAAAAAASSRLGELRALLGWPEAYLAEEPIAAIAERATTLAGSLDLAPRWVAFELSRSQAAAGLAGELLPRAMAGEVAFPDLGRAFRRSFLQQWLTAVVTARPSLRDFHTLTHEERIAEFERLDLRVLQENRAALVARQRDEVQRRLQTPEVRAAMPFLKREMARQRAHAPLRKTLRQAGAAIWAIKPCFMMSPLTVSQLLDGQTSSFDLVVFDEASQLPAEDAVGAIARGRQLVVVGDPKQLPPTNFFSVMGGQVNAPVGEDGTPLFEDSESILEDFMGAGVPSTRLKWHYRSTQESLITFSNVSFYDADLYTFPSVDTDHRRGLLFEYVDGGIYEGKGVNPVEARRVADAVVRHARECPELTLGVGTFSLRQQLAIQDEIELRRRQDPRLEPFFARREEGSFFVKNLENIQGDERDVIFLSVTYGRDREGKLRYNFGPINGENGWRRLNVLTTRAKRSMRVFASIHGDAIRAVDTTSRGARLLHDFLLYAEHGRIERPIPKEEGGEAGETSNLPFEWQVQDELERAGIEFRRAIGLSRYPVDFGILDSELPGTFFCGVECDGPHYRRAETVRDRDRLRRQVLEARGWTIHRVWSTDWFKDRPGQVERLLGLIAGTRQRAREEAAAEEEARARAEVEKAAAEAEAQAAEAEARLRSESAAQSLAEPPPSSPSPTLPSQAQAVEYRLASGEGRHGGDLLAAPLADLIDAVIAVAQVEAPLHIDDLMARVAGMWGLARVGSRIERRLAEACGAAERRRSLEPRGDFIWLPGGGVVVRSRAGTSIPAERIPPEEIREAVLLVLRAGGLDRRELINQVRTLFGFNRTGTKLQTAIGAVVDTLLADGTLGEGSSGVRLREEPG